ncbi:MAG: 4-hydroxy-3-methylbut-2-en-1-yl diphosphate synthase, partial [Sphingobacteriales bacterium]
MLQYFTPSLTHYSRLATREVRIGNLTLGNFNPVRVQTMTTTDTMDTEATVAQTIRCIEAGAELVRITAPSKKEAENLLEIKNRVRAAGFDTPLVADIHFTPNAAEIAARLIEKVRVNPGNYVDKKRFDHIEYTDAEYAQEIDRIRERFTPLVKICREYGTAMRIGTNHGSLSDRIMSRYGDTAMGMVESAMEFLRIARAENYHQIILSMKSSNPQVMVQAYRLLIRQMDLEFGECYPMHLGVTEAGDGEDGRIKSAIGIGTLLEDGIGDTIRVSLTEDPEFEIPVCRDIVDRYAKPQSCNLQIPEVIRLPYDPFSYARRLTQPAMNLGGTQVPVVVSDFSHFEAFSHQSFESIGYRYDPSLDKWQIGDQAADFVYCGAKHPGIALPGTLGVILESAVWSNSREEERCFPMFDLATYRLAADRHPALNFVMIESYSGDGGFESALLELAEDPTVVLCLYSANTNCMQTIRRAFAFLLQEKITNPVIICIKSSEKTPDTHLIHFATEAGALLLDGFGDGIMLSYHPAATLESLKTGGRTYLEVKNREQFTNNTAFSILQATRTRISKTEYISCPSCGRTLFDLQETTAKIRTATSHLKGVKIAIMGCIVNGPG